MGLYFTKKKLNMSLLFILQGTTIESFLINSIFTIINEQNHSDYTENL